MAHRSFHVSPPSQILLVDSDMGEMQPLLTALRKEQHQISLAFGAMEGYRKATALQPDLIILEAKSDGIDGIASCRRLRGDPATAHIPIIFVSKSGSLEDRLTGLRAGAVDYILKPFEPAEVVARVTVHLALAHRGAGQPAFSQPQSPAAGTHLPVSHADHVIAEAAKRIVLDELGNVPSLTEISERLGTHEKRLSKVFRACTGLGVFEFARDARFAEARRLLSHSALTVEEVATAVGFAVPANFSTAFRGRYGITPSAFRTKHRAAWTSHRTAGIEREHENGP